MKYTIHQQSICETENIGKDTIVGAFSHISANSLIGEGCTIGNNVFIDSDVALGDKNIIHNSAQIYSLSKFANNVTIGPNATVGSDIFHSKSIATSPKQVIIIHQGASIGANCTIAPGVQIGRDAVIKASSNVTQDVPAKAIVSGNPIQIDGYIDTVPVNQQNNVRLKTISSNAVITTNIPHVTLHTLKQIKDLRGSLSVGNFSKEIPFSPKRYFIVYDVPGKNVRGEHAHRKCQQFLICVKGALKVLIDNGKNREEFLLDNPNIGLYIPPMTWAVQYKHSNDGVLLVYASKEYDPEDYIRDYETFLKAVKRES